MRINHDIASAATEGKLSRAAVERLQVWLKGGFLPEWALTSLSELTEREEWGELNERFYRDLEFGTGGMRGRSIGKVTSSRERGGFPDMQTSPDYPAVGAHCFNDFNVIRATIGLFRYVKLRWNRRADSTEALKLVVAYDVRHFSQHFGELTASVWTRLGGQALIFSGPRATPELSFAVRYLGASAGVVISASHNPPHDNGYKVYLDDGAQATPEPAKAIMREIGGLELETLGGFLEKDLEGVSVLPDAVDEAYLKTLGEHVLDEAELRRTRFRVVFTPFHGTGQVCTLPLLKRYGIEVITVQEQMTADARFPTVTSPNPEDAGAFARAIAIAENSDAEVIFATDPDADRLGAAVRCAKGGFEVLSGNVIGAALAEYRIVQLKERGLLPSEGSQHAALITTFVTTPMIGAIAQGHGVQCVETLTGFKWIGAKLQSYEATLRAQLSKRKGTNGWDYTAMDTDERRRLLLEYSTYCIFAVEESYGYLANDHVRDKDAHAALIVFCELVAHLKQRGLTFGDYLDKLYLKYGYFDECLVNVYYEGSQGAERISRILASYRNRPPQKIGKWAVVKSTDFGCDVVYDEDGERLPWENFYRFELANGYRFAVRSSGTEPKIKFYLFGYETAGTYGELETAKQSTRARLADIEKAVKSDAYKRTLE